MYQQLWGYKVKEKLYLGVREQKSLNTIAIDNRATGFQLPAEAQTRSDRTQPPIQ
jgi:hypothetical protein